MRELTAESGQGETVSPDDTWLLMDMLTASGKDIKCSESRKNVHAARPSIISDN